MISELTTEEIVTQLLSAEEILTPNKEQLCSSTKSLGKFLSKLPTDNKQQNTQFPKETKYTFIENNLWNY